MEREWLYQKYVVEGLSTYQIGKLVQRDPKTVYFWLKKFDIPTRQRRWDNKSGSLPFHNEVWLRQQYVLQQRSASEIASEFGVTDENIYHFLKKFGIERRDVSEARAVKHWGLAGEKNPMFGKHGEDVPNWKGGVTPERQSFYSSLEWKRASEAVWQRDQGVCQRCRRKEMFLGERAFVVHHIVSFKVKELRAELTNLVLLCQKCHRWVHSRKNINHEWIG